MVHEVVQPCLQQRGSVCGVSGKSFVQNDSMDGLNNFSGITLKEIIRIKIYLERF